MLILNDVLFWAGAVLSVISAYRMCLSERKQGHEAGELHISPRADRPLMAARKSRSISSPIICILDLSP